MKKSLLFYLMVPILLSLGSCTKDQETDVKPPSISFANTEGIFEVKIARTLKLEAEVADAIDPYYVWKLDGNIVSRETSYEFSSKTAGQYYLTFQVNAANGKIEKEVRVDVLDLTPPCIELPAVAGYIDAVTDIELKIIPIVAHGEGASYQWLLDRKEVSTEPTYLFRRAELGEYNLALVVTNEDGTARADAIIRVVEVPELSFWFENKVITVPFGRTVQLAPYISYASESTVFEWYVDGTLQTGITGSIFSFTPSAEKEYIIEVKGINEDFSSDATVTVQCVAAEGTYFRPVTANSSANLIEVFEFLPAPGQFVNEGYTATTQAEANAYAQKQMDAGGLISLGAYGGYIAVKFDHSVENKPGYNLAIKGNALATWAEQGIVWVMQDENGNGLPDDTWYELRGSDTDLPGTRQQYAVTYYRPNGNRQNVRWTDNHGGSGTVDINGYHMQGSYYPNWITSASYTLRGTCLQGDIYDQSGTGTYWVSMPSKWGYVDNGGEDYFNSETYLDLDNAMYPDGTPVNLKYIDFVKVQTGVNAMGGWLGEVSTEVLGFRDMNMK